MKTSVFIFFSKFFCQTLQTTYHESMSMIPLLRYCFAVKKTNELRKKNILPKHIFGYHFLTFFYKSLWPKFFIGTVCLNFGLNNYKEFRPYLVLLTELLKKSVCVDTLYFNIQREKIQFIFSLERFSFLLYSSIGRRWMFLWWIAK